MDGTQIVIESLERLLLKLYLEIEGISSFFDNLPVGASPDGSLLRHLLMFLKKIQRKEKQKQRKMKLRQRMLKMKTRMMPLVLVEQNQTCQGVRVKAMTIAIEILPIVNFM